MASEIISKEAARAHKAMEIKRRNELIRKREADDARIKKFLQQNNR